MELKNPVNVETAAVESDMTITVLDGTWEIGVCPARTDQAPNAVFLQVRHKPRRGEPDLPPGGIRFGLTEAEVYRIALALIEGATGDREQATQALRTFLATAQKADRLERPTVTRQAMSGSEKMPFTKTQGRYLAFIHRYVTKFGRAPSEADMQRHFLVSAPSVNAMMQTLTRNGLISRIPGVPRSIQLLVPPELLPGDRTR